MRIHSIIRIHTDSIPRIAAVIIPRGRVPASLAMATRPEPDASIHVLRNNQAVGSMRFDAPVVLVHIAFVQRHALRTIRFSTRHEIHVSWPMGMG